MKNILNFLMEAGKLKDIKRKGITFYGVKNPDSAIDHSFRMAMMVWLFVSSNLFPEGKNSKKINLEKAIKMALIHDICKVYTGDITPYDDLLPKNKKERNGFVREWPRLSLDEKQKKHAEKFENELAALKELTAKLPRTSRDSIMNVWLDYHKYKSPEAKFVAQLNIIENLIEAFERWQKNKDFPTKPWWEHAAEIIDDPILLKFLKKIKEEELKK